MYTTTNVNIYECYLYIFWSTMVLVQVRVVDINKYSCTLHVSAAINLHVDYWHILNTINTLYTYSNKSITL